MRLINIYTLQMQEFFDRDTPRYAILSHTWGPEEITFQEWQAILEFQDLDLDPGDTSGPDERSIPNSYAGQQRRKVNAVKAKAGYEKVIRFCETVKAYDDPLVAHAFVNRHDAWLDREPLNWVWIDTCCIDKTSSAELSEAINSMYRWYQESMICIVYLSDVSNEDRAYGADGELDFLNSRWHTRGWTLQELLAPSNIDFFEAGWQKIGDEDNLMDLVGKATGIDEEYLTKSSQLLEEEGATQATLSISLRMSWASCRETTRSEDRAYCLLGLFGVNMPLLYGEGGRRAFIRLQEEIMKQSTDHTIFAWGYGMALAGDRIIDGKGEILRRPEFDDILAPSPAYFLNGNLLVPLVEEQDPPFQMTNKGLQICLRLRKSRTFHRAYVALLNCAVASGKNDEKKYFIGLYLHSRDIKYGSTTSTISEGDFFQKFPTSKPIAVKFRDYKGYTYTKNTVFLRRNFDISNESYPFLKPKPSGFDLAIASTPLPSKQWTLHQVVPPCKTLSLCSRSEHAQFCYRFDKEYIMFQEQWEAASSDLHFDFRGPTYFRLKVCSRWGGPYVPSQDDESIEIMEPLTDWRIFCQDLDSMENSDNWVQIPLIENGVVDISEAWDLEPSLQWPVPKLLEAPDSLKKQLENQDSFPYAAVVYEVILDGRFYCNFISIFVSESAITRRKQGQLGFHSRPQHADLVEGSDIF